MRIRIHKEGKRPLFYKDLCDYLEMQEDSMKEKLYGTFHYKFEENDKPYGIAVYDEDDEKPLTYLKSDQLGFSVPSIKLNHIYDHYLTKKNGDIKNVIKWVKNSRTLGGSFLWPMEKGSKGKWQENPDFNVKRGGTERHGSYIKDRADLTLIEIKNYLDCPHENRIEHYKEKYRASKGTNSKKYQVLYCSVTRANSNMKKWLDHFYDFKEYVEFFSFESFMNPENSGEPELLTEAGENIYSLDKDRMESMLEKLSGENGQIVSRSRKMGHELSKNRI